MPGGSALPITGKLSPQQKSMRDAFTAFNYVQYILENKVHRTAKTTLALIALEDARSQALTQIKLDHVEEHGSSLALV